MFVLTKIQDIVRVHPSQFSLSRLQAVTDVLNLKYSYKILSDIGLCLQVYDVHSISEPVVHACQDGSYQCTTVFRMIVFRPMEGQVLMGKIKECDAKKGVRVSMEFFDDIYIPAQYLMAGTELFVF